MDGRKSGLSLVGADADVSFYADRYASGRTGPVLVLGSGRGRVACGLAARGISVVGVEPSERLAAAAESLRSEHPQDIADRLRLIRADPRSLRLNEQFSAVFAPENAFGLVRSIEELDAFLATVRHHLLPGGLFCLDVLNAPSSGDPDDEGALGKDSHAVREPRRPLFKPHLRDRKDAASRGGAIRRLTLRAFSVDELQSALGSHGLSALERYGSFDAKPFDADSPLQVLVCERRDG